MSSGDPQASDVQPEPTQSSGDNLTPIESTDKGTAKMAVSEAPATDSLSSGGAAVEPSAVATPETGTSTAQPTAPAAPSARGLGVAKPSSPSAGPLAAKMKGLGNNLGAGETANESKQSAGKQGSSGGRPSGKGPQAKPMGPTLGPFRPGKMKPGKSVDTPKDPNAPVSAAELENQADAVEQAQADGKQSQGGYKAKVSVPNLRHPLSDDLQAELESALATADVDSILGGSAGMPDRVELEEGQKVRGKILKIDDESVYVSLGGPNEGAVSKLQFTEETLPEVGSMVEVTIRGFNNADGLYNLVVPGQALDVSDWEDLEEGTVVEAHVAAANTGGLEATVGNIRGFIPISQIAQYRIEDATEFVGQRLMCLVTECNARRKNLVLSHRAILEREREEQRQQQLEKIEPGDVMEGTVRSVKDFGAFVDLGGLDGLIHITKLSWDHVKSAGDVLTVGQKVKVKIDKIDKQTGKIGLSYRDLMENPWDAVEATMSVGSICTGTVTRMANFGAFVRLAAGIEGLVHISEVAGHRVSNVNSVLKEGEEVTVKVLSVERESQRISLSIKQAQSKAADSAAKVEEEVEEPPRELAVKRQHEGPLKGGTGSGAGGNPFGLNW
jgi:predicted RNA-binding protein with RPS1 domain